MKKHIIILAIFFTLCGCDNSPVAKLKSDTKYPELEKVWRAESGKKSELWRQAIAYCKQHDGKPNCGAVMFIDAVLSTDTKVTGKLDAHPINNPFDKS